MMALNPLRAKTAGFGMLCGMALEANDPSLLNHAM